jgi:ELWxxDGT repeat protein
MRYLTPSAVALITLLCSAGVHAQAPYLVMDVFPGPAGSDAAPLAAGDRVFFSAGRPDLGFELWVTSGTEASTTFVDVLPGPDGFYPQLVSALGDEILFGRLFESDGLWRSDGTAPGTRRISDIDPNGFLSARLSDKVLFADPQLYPAVTDGSVAGTSLVPPPLGSTPQSLSLGLSPAPFAEGFAMVTGSFTFNGAWWADGSGPATYLVPTSFNCRSVAAAAGRLFVECETGATGVGQLAVSDGTFSGTQYLSLFPMGLNGPLVAAGNLVFFTVQGALWRSDGTVAGTLPVPITGPTPTAIGLSSAAGSNGVLYFSATTVAEGRELWRTDGTAAGTFSLRDIEPGPGSSVEDHLPTWITPAAGGVVFAANTTAGGREVWKSDGTSAGTVPLPEIVPGPGSSFPELFTSAGGRVYFRAYEPSTGRELWAVDVAPGAVAVGDTTIEEGDTGTVVASFPVRLESVSPTPVVVAYTTVAGTAQAGSDFLARSGVLTFAPGTRELSVDVPVAGDVADEANESFALVVTPTGGAVISDGRGDAVILDDDAPRLAIAGPTVTEGTGGLTNASFAVTVTAEGGGPLASPVAVRYLASSGSATEGVDFAAVQGSLTFPAGSASGTTLNADVWVTGDSLDEPNETFQVTFDGQNDATVPEVPAIGVILDDDGIASAPPRELSHGVTYRGDLAPPGGRTDDRDFYVLQQHSRSSYELVVDEVSGDAAPLQVRRVWDADTTVFQEAQALGTGGSLSLRWQSTISSPSAHEHVRIESPGCGSACGADDVYRLRFYETTLRAPRVNNVDGQVTAVIVTNTAPVPVTGAIHLYRHSGTLVATLALQLEPHATLVSDLSQSVVAFSGSLAVAHDGPYGALVGKVVALEPATGFSFDTPLTSRPR